MSEFDRPTVLLVGEGERMHSALVQALERHGLLVETVTSDKVVEAAFAAAPDILVLLGNAAKDLGRTAVGLLSEHAAASSVPVVLLSDEAGLGSRLDAFRHGVVAVVPRTASADGMARRIAEIARELPDRPGEVDGDLGEATVDDLVALFSQQLRSGILSVTAADDQSTSAQVVLRAGRPVTEAIGELVDRLRPLVQAQPGPLRYEFHESPEARLGLLEDEDEDESRDEVLRGRRVLLLEQNPARADLLVQELRARGALVVVADGEGNGLDRARSQDPDVVVLDGSGVEGWALPALRRLRREPRLRWASLLVVDTAELWPGDGTHPDMNRLCAGVAPLLRHDRELADQALARDNFDTRLERIGPARMLRALTSTGLGLGLSISHPRVRVQLDLAEGLVVGARAFSPGSDREIAEGPAALAALMGLGSGRVRIEHRDAPSAANVMAPVDDALNVASAEEPPIAPSLPPPSGIHVPAPGIGKPPPVPSTPKTGRSEAEADALMGKLEQLLERLQDVLPAAEASVRQTRRPPANTGPATGSPVGPAAGKGRLGKPGLKLPPPRRRKPAKDSPGESPSGKGSSGKAPSSRASPGKAPSSKAPSSNAPGRRPTAKPNKSTSGRPAERRFAEPRFSERRFSERRLNAPQRPSQRPTGPPSRRDDVPTPEVGITRALGASKRDEQHRTVRPEPLLEEAASAEGPAQAGSDHVAAPPGGATPSNRAGAGQDRAADTTVGEDDAAEASVPAILIAPPTASAGTDPHQRPTPHSGLMRPVAGVGEEPPERRGAVRHVGTQTLAFGTPANLLEEESTQVTAQAPPEPKADGSADSPSVSRPGHEAPFASTTSTVSPTPDTAAPAGAWDDEGDDDDFDIPVIQATAEPSALTDLSQLRAANEPSLPPPAARPVPRDELPPTDPPPALPQRGGRALLWVGVAVLALGLSGGAALAYWMTTQGSPTDVQPPVVAAQPDAGASTLILARLPDSGPSAAAASGPESPDAGTSGPGSDAGSDAGTDAGIDAGATEDAGTDAGPPDAGTDAGPEVTVDELIDGVEVDIDPNTTPAQRRRQEVAALLRRANYRRNQGEYAEAERTYLQVLRREQNNARALAGMTRLALARGQNAAASRWARQLVTNRPSNPANQVLLGDALAAAGNRAQAEAAWRRALETNPNYPAARRRLR